MLRPTHSLLPPSKLPNVPGAHPSRRQETRWSSDRRSPSHAPPDVFDPPLHAPKRAYVRCQPLAVSRPAPSPHPRDSPCRELRKVRACRTITRQIRLLATLSTTSSPDRTRCPADPGHRTPNLLMMGRPSSLGCDPWHHQAVPFGTSRRLGGRPDPKVCALNGLRSPVPAGQRRAARRY